MELLAPRLGVDPDGAFTAGLLSGVQVLFRVPLGALLAVVLQAETGGLAPAPGAVLPADAVAAAYLEALTCSVAAGG